MGNLFEEISHYSLCKLTAEWQIKKHKVVLWEYQNTAVNEFPDCLCFKDGMTRLFEIKVNRSDFLKDSEKECRNEKVIKYFPQYKMRNGKIKHLLFESSSWKPEIKEFIKQHPHLGRERYYVCPKGLIKKEEIKNGFGLYYFTGKSFRKQKESQSFKSNIYDELRILEHAFRRYYSEGFERNMLINGYIPDER